MSHTADDSAPDFDLPEQILSVIPSDPYDQLDLARKITSMAIASRVSKLESETSVLRQRVCDQDRLVFELQDRVSSLQQSCIDADSRLKSVLDENLKLTEERDSLAATVKRLSRDVSKLETFKRQLMQSLSEDTSSSDTVDIGTCDQAVPRAYQHEGDSTNGYRRYHSFTGPATSEVRLVGDEASKANGQRFSMTPYQITPRLTPTGTPKIVSATGSPKAHSTVGSPPKNSGATTPTEMSYDGRISLSSYYPSSKQSSAANSPPRGRVLPGRTPRIDGKEFFRQARSRLSYEQFSAFLANIKEFNAQKQTREETLRKAEEIFGTYNKDLYLSFQGLLNRNVH